MKYVGEFKHGKNHGYGTLIFPVVEIWDGDFIEDMPCNPTNHDKDGNIFGKYVTGKLHIVETTC